jgi:lysophospholipase L1-like esterase
MKKKFLIIPFLFLFFGFTVDHNKKITVYLIGDSTMSIKEKRAYLEMGWGVPFVHFFDTTVVVDNRAKNGRSTRTFLEEKLWQPVYKQLKEGDYVFIQFGHNDESKEKADRYTTPEQYKNNLLRFINETKSKKAIPVLLTPVSRRRFKDGKAIESHELYSSLVREVAANTGVHFIDLDKKSIDLYQQLGDEKSKLLFLQLKPGEHPNYPDGKFDNTHFNELGARLIAQLVLAEIRNLNADLKNRIVKPVKKTADENI